MTSEDSAQLRRELISTALAMNAAGINVNRSGNVSARCGGPRLLDEAEMQRVRHRLDTYRAS